MRKPLGKLRVLVVDDEIHLCRLMTRELEHVGIGFYDYATSYESAIDKLERYHFDVVISDVMMPGKTGVDLYYSVSYRWPKIVFGFTSAVEQKLPEKTAFFWLKPFDFEKIEPELLAVAKGKA